MVFPFLGLECSAVLVVDVVSVGGVEHDDVLVDCAVVAEDVDVDVLPSVNGRDSVYSPRHCRVA